MLYSRQLFGVGSRVQAKVKMPLASDQLEHASFSFGLQSVINGHKISDAEASQQKPFYAEHMDEINSQEPDSDVFCVRFSLNAS